MSNGIIIGASNLQTYKERHTVGDNLVTLSMLSGCNLYWHNFAIGGSNAANMSEQVNLATSIVTDFQVVLIGLTSELVNGDYRTFVNHIAHKMWPLIKKAPYVLLTKYPELDHLGQTYIDNRLSYNALVDRWTKNISNVYTAEYPFYNRVDEIHPDEATAMAHACGIHQKILRWGL